MEIKHTKCIVIGIFIVVIIFEYWHEFSESVVVPNRPDYVYYHQKLRRVPTIDECYTDDAVCRFEAQQQFNRDKYVPSLFEMLTELTCVFCIPG